MEGEREGERFGDALLFEPHIKCSRVAGQHTGERGETSACGCTSGATGADMWRGGGTTTTTTTTTSKSSICSLTIVALIDTDISALGFLQG